VTSDAPPQPLDIGAGWTTWPTFCLRHAGMPFEWLRYEGPDWGDLPPAERPDAMARRRAGLRERIADPLVRQALELQNPRAGRLAVRDRRKWVRGDYRPMAAYLSRYCAKNDTIGFFGQEAWGRWSEHATSVTAVQSPPARRNVYLELWAVRAVAAALVETHQLRPWTRPVLMAAIAVDADGVLLGDGTRLHLRRSEIDFVRRCDGTRTALELISKDPDPAEAGRRLDRLEAMGVLACEFPLRQERHPEVRLRAMLAAVANPARRRSALADLDAVECARDVLSKSLGDPDEMAPAIAALAATIGAITHGPTHVRDGEYYAGRTVVYEDSPSDVRPDLARSVLAEIAPALVPVLHSARWFCHDIAERVRAFVLAEMAGSGDEGIPLGLLLPRLLAALDEAGTGLVDLSRAELHARWATVLGNGDGPVTLDGADLAGAAALFPAAGPGWPSARWHSPDVMLCAASTAELGVGRWAAVLGELHVAGATVNQVMTLGTHPDLGEMNEWFDADVPDRVVPMYSIRDGQINSRTAPPDAFPSARHRYLGIWNEPGYAPDGAVVLPAGALRVVERDGAAVVRSSVDDAELDLLVVLDDLLSLAALSRFDLVGLEAGHTPRITAGRVVLVREGWRLAFGDLPEPRGDQIGDVVDAVRELRDRLGLPRRVFALVSGERKPVFVDFADPLAADVLWAKVRRQRGRHPDGFLKITEMLPGPEQLWLCDDADRRYTCEVRMVCCDPEQYAPR
jgi:hypothetical protein